MANELPPVYWVITKDKISSGRGAVGTEGPGHILRKFPKRPPEKGVKWQKFRMLDDDGNIYYYGKIYLRDDLIGGEAEFSPLWDFGEPYAGCTEIQYREGSRWVPL
jgi:hypothetical protein